MARAINAPTICQAYVNQAFWYYRYIELIYKLNFNLNHGAWNLTIKFF